jgi:hypothetical protein
VVVTSCGLSIAQEALLKGKSLLCLPSTAEQAEVAARLTNMGLAFTCRTGNVAKSTCLSIGIRRLLKVRGENRPAGVTRSHPDGLNE